MRLLPVVILGTVVLFFAGLIAPRRSKRLGRWIDRRLEQGRLKSRRKAGRIGDWMAKSLRFGQRLADGALRVGRRARGWLPV
jgi:hypothetical protein